MITNREILDRVIDRYDVAELTEVLGVQDVVDEDVLDSDIEDFVKVFRGVIIRKQKELDIW